MEFNKKLVVGSLGAVFTAVGAILAIVSEITPAETKDSKEAE